MRILTIRGKNLASLADDFEVSLETGALQQVGLFAITGPTGSGKSTILDALCLALYDQMPRLPEGHGVAIGHKGEDEAVRVKSHDVSSILRRGTADAYAEVDFIGQDKQTYRARWEISRARGKVNGRLQAQKISLQNLQSAEKIGQGKKDTQLEIVKRLGLNFDQFRRSVLLAQGDFAAFLKARKDERSSLLEKITGTDIYSELSIAAFERAKLEKQQLDNILEKLADKVPLAIAVRTELEQEKNQLAERLSTLQQALKAKQKNIAWFDSHALLKQEQQGAYNKVQLAQHKWDEHLADRALLQQVEQAQPLRPLLQLVQNREQEWQDADNKLTDTQTALVKAEHQLSIVSQQEIELIQQYVSIKKNHSDAQPLLIAARKLDTQIDDSKSRLSAVTTATEVQQEKWQTAAYACDEINRQKNQQTSRLQQLNIWQEQHIATQKLANEWQRWEAELKNYIALDQELQQETKICSELQTEIRLLKNKRQILQTDSDQTLAERKQLTDELELIEKQVLTMPLADLHEQKSQLESEQETLNTALLLAEKGLAERLLLRQDQAALSGMESSSQTANKQIQQLIEQQTVNQTQLLEAQQAFSLMQAASAKSATQLRALLQDQQPCPICGSEQHPWADLSQAIQLPVSEQQSRVNILQKTKEQLIKDLSEQNSLLKQADKAKLEITERIAKSEILQASLIQKWSPIVLHKKPKWADIQQAYITHLTEQSNVLKNDYVKMKTQENELLKQHSRLPDLHVQTEKLSQLYAIQIAEIAELDKKNAQQQSTQLAKKVALQRIETEKIKLVEMLSVPFKQVDNWHEQLIQNTTLYLSKIATDVSLWQRKLAQKTLIEEQIQTIEKQILTAEPEKIHQQKLYTQYKGDLEQQSSLYAKLEIERKQYFNGASATDFAENIEQQLLRADANKQAVAKELTVVEMDIKACGSTIGHWLKEKQRREDIKISAERELSEDLLARQMNMPVLQQLLLKDSTWITEQKEVNQALAIVLQESETALKLNTQSLQKHECETPEESKQSAQEQIDHHVEQLDKLTQDKENNAYLLRTDDEKISTGKGLQLQLQIQRQCWEKWESLNELIGSSSGHKFRIFAQGLTLETLLSYANRHLLEFARRYYLQRVPGSDLELQVIDRDMADEVRSVHSLSGGESFLVSLALALGLASLSSNQTQVESLFIDEGFGSLDLETLDIAIASLDTLQSLGRKVGVISHVAVLVERIGAQVVVEKLGGGKSIVTVKANA